jgi:hypothetical protein
MVFRRQLVFTSHGFQPLLKGLSVHLLVSLPL